MTRILLVDDDLDLLNVAKNFLTDENPNFELITTHSPVEALQKIAEEQFDVMVSDYRMPTMDGLALLKRIREEGNEIPFIMFTGHGREEVAMQALNLGADYYLMKSDEPESLYGELTHIIHRVTEHKHMQQALRESEEKYRELIEELHEGILVEDSEEKITFVNPQTIALLGYSFEELVGQPTSIIIPEDERENIHNETVKRPLGISSTYESALMTKAGRRIPVIISTTPLFFESGKFRGILSLFTDITERKRVEELLRDNEERFRRLTEQNLMGIVIVQDGMLKYVNQACSEISGYSIEEMMTWNQKRFLQVVHQEDLPLVVEQLMKKQAGEKDGVIDRYSVRLVVKGGKLKFANLYSKSIIYQGKPADFVMLVDVTEQKQAEETLRESEERYRSLFHFSNDGIFIHDLEGKIIDVNKKALGLLGYSKDELLALTIADLHPPQMLEKSRTAFMGISQAGYVNFEIDFQKKNGETFSADVSSSIFEIGGEKVVQGIVRDISDRKEIEQQLHHEREELSEFAHTLSHDLRNFLHSIQGHASLIRREHDLPRAEKIINLAQRMNKLLARSLALADAGLIVDKTDRISLAEIAQKVAELTIPEGITIYIDLDPLPEVLCDREKAAEVFQNLFENAIIHGLSKDSISITIRNDGKPIPPDTRPQIFQRGFSTAINGLGLGLAIAKRVIEAHGWQISLEETPETSFRIIIPL
ncbi:MAG: PAS domain S-box protein [Candidatus Hodarchaeales archaeon]|jgi:PAS domain S-box-containing protein